MSTSYNDEFSKNWEFILSKHTKITPTGKTSRKYADSLAIYLDFLIKNYKDAETMYCKSRMIKMKKDLIKLGYDNEYVEKWREIYKNEPKPKVEILELIIDLSPSPSPDYCKSPYYEHFKSYLKKE